MIRTYIVTRKADGAEVFRYQVDTDNVIAPIEWGGMEFATHDHTLEPLPDEPVTDTTVYGGRRILSKLEFLRLFTMPERIGMRTAAKQSPVMEDYMALMDLAQEINLDDPDTQAGVQMMEQAGLLAVGRAAEVLHG